MTFGTFVGVALLLLLAGVIGLECTTGLADPPVERPIKIVAAPASEPTSAPEATPDERARQVAAILARPLFSPDRRPPSEPLVAVIDVPVPRLTGTLLGPFGRHAVLAVGDRQISRAEGDEFDGWTVHEVDNGKVSLLRPDQSGQLRLIVITGKATPVASAEPSMEGFAWTNPCGRRHKPDAGGRTSDAASPACKSALAAVQG